MLRRIVCGALLASSSTSALAARVAVVPAVAENGDAAERAAAALRAQLASDVDVVLTREETQIALRGPAGAPVDIARTRALVQDADAAFAALEHERSVALLEQAIAALESEPDFSAEKRALLEEIRLRCAQRLLGLAGPSETGNAETKQGQAARRHLQSALRANPRLELTKVPPKLRMLADLAAKDVAALGFGGLAVTSTPTGATVMLDARPVGVTPLETKTAAPPGTYRLWVELPTSDLTAPPQRSFARTVTLDAGAVLTANIDAQFESSLRGEQVGLAPTSAWRAPQLARLATLLRADVVVVVGVDADPAAPLWALRYSAEGLRTARAVDVDALPASLATSTSTSTATVPASFFVAEPAVAVAPVEDAGVPWLWLGVGAGAVVVVAGAAVAAGVVLATSGDTVTVSLAELE